MIKWEVDSYHLFHKHVRDTHIELSQVSYVSYRAVSSYPPTIVTFDYRYLTQKEKLILLAHTARRTSC